MKKAAICVRVEQCIKEALKTVAKHEMRSEVNMLEAMIVSYCKNKGISIEEE